jgi:UDP-GlcNAc:undecaprenyl-phosphate GlcNAc-1-phosphate transferase
VAAGTCYVLVPLTKKLAVKIDAIDYPGDRRLNTAPTPRLGGLALLGGLLAAMAVEYIGEVFFGWGGIYNIDEKINVNYLVALLGVCFMVLVGTIDDIFQLSPGVKFIGQVLAACIITASGVLLSEIRNPLTEYSFYFGWFAYPATVFYLVFFANIINLIDGLDGLACGLVGIAALTLLIIAFGKERVEAAIFAAVTLGICVAFLRYNFPPATVFMGDSGALLLGTLLGLISLTGVMRSPSAIVLTVPIVVAGLPALDTLLAVIRRIRDRKPIHAADMEHLHHKLLRKGASPKRVLATTYIWTAILAIGAILISNTSGIVVIALFIVLALISLVILWTFGLFDGILRHFYTTRPKTSATGSFMSVSKKGHDHLLKRESNADVATDSDIGLDTNLSDE